MIYEKLVIAFKNKNQTDFDINSKLLLTILDDMDKILSANENFLLGKWIENARSIAQTEQVYLKKYTKIFDYLYKHLSFNLFSYITGKAL